MLAVARTYAGPHTVVELPENCEYLRWYIEACKNIPHQLSVDRVNPFLQVDEALVLWNSPLVRVLAIDARRTACRLLFVRDGRYKLLLREYSPRLTVVAKARRSNFQQYFACMGNQRTPSAIVAIRAIPLFGRDLDDRIFPLLGDCFRYPYIDKDAVEALLDVFGVIEFQWLSREAVSPDRFPVRQNLDNFRHLVHGGFVSEWCFERSGWQYVDHSGIEFMRFRVQECVVEPPPSFPN